MSKIIRTVDELMKHCGPEEAVDFAIQLNGPVFSRKEIFYHHPDETEDPEYKDKFEVTNCIDETTQLLTRQEISDPNSEITNIGKAMSLNSFYKI